VALVTILRENRLNRFIKRNSRLRTTHRKSRHQAQRCQANAPMPERVIHPLKRASTPIPISSVDRHFPSTSLNPISNPNEVDHPSPKPGNFPGDSVGISPTQCKPRNNSRLPHKRQRWLGLHSVHSKNAFLVSSVTIPLKIDRPPFLQFEY